MKGVRRYRPWYHERRQWQNPFYSKGWKLFWHDVFGQAWFDRIVRNPNVR